MAVTQNTPFASSVGNGVTTVFPYAFLLLSESDLVVTFDGVTQVSGFTVAGVGNPSGGNVTFTTPPASGVVVTLARILPLARSIDYQDAGDLLAATLNGDFDRLWLALQQLQQNDLRALKLRFEETVDQVIPGTPAERAGQYIGFDATGARVTLLAGTPGSVAVTPYMQTVLAAINAAEARTTLGAAALTSPAFTGTPTSTTPSAGDNSTRVATTAYVRGEINAIPAQRALADQAQAEAGTDNTVDMSPLRTRQAIDARAVIRGFPDLARRYEEFTDLIGATSGLASGAPLSASLTVFGGAGVVTTPFYETGRPGLVRVAESGATGVQSGIQLRDFVRMDATGDFEVVLRTIGVVGNGYIYRVGWYNNANTVGIGFLGQTAVNANWLVQAGNGTPTTQITSSVALANTGFTRLRCRRVNADTFAFSINGGAETNVTRAGAGANWPADASSVRLKVECVNSNTGFGPETDAVFFSTLGASR